MLLVGRVEVFDHLRLHKVEEDLTAAHLDRQLVVLLEHLTRLTLLEERQAHLTNEKREEGTVCTSNLNKIENI